MNKVLIEAAVRYPFATVVGIERDEQLCVAAERHAAAQVCPFP